MQHGQQNVKKINDVFDKYCFYLLIFKILSRYLINGTIFEKKNFA